MIVVESLPYPNPTLWAEFCHNLNLNVSVPSVKKSSTTLSVMLLATVAYGVFGSSVFWSKSTCPDVVVKSLDASKKLFPLTL